MAETIEPALEAAPMRLHHHREETREALHQRAQRLNTIGGLGYECADFLTDVAAYLGIKVDRPGKRARAALSAIEAAQ